MAVRQLTDPPHRFRAAWANWWRDWVVKCQETTNVKPLVTPFPDSVSAVYGVGLPIRANLPWLTRAISTTLLTRSTWGASRSVLAPRWMICVIVALGSTLIKVTFFWSNAVVNWFRTWSDRLDFEQKGRVKAISRWWKPHRFSYPNHWKS